MKLTTIQVDSLVRTKLERLKNHPRETLNDVVSRLIGGQEDGSPSRKELDEIEIGLAQIRRGQTVPIEKAAHELGIKL
ncbi:MAG: hypothetical protein V1820_00090 [archaeon]